MMHTKQMRSLSFLKRTIGTFTVLAAFLCTLSAGAQNRNSGEIRGTVTDSTGAVVPGVAVDAINVATGIHVKGTTTAQGQFDLPYVSPGDYTVSFARSGFQKLVKTGVTVQVGTITMNAALQPGEQTTSITVSAAPALIETETSQLSTTLERHAVSQLPLVGGNWLSLTELLPGAAPAKGGSGSPGEGDNTNSAGGENVSINGAQAFQSSWLIDGGVATLPVSNNPDLLSPPVEAIQEVDMTTDSFGAEYGNGLATFNVILKSGTNAFHGSLWEFNQNDVFDAAPRNWSSVPQRKPAVRFNMFGGAIGGPVVRNRLFFFFSFQDNPTSTHVSSLYTFPTDAMRAGDFSASSFPTIYDPSTTVKSAGITTRTPFPGNQVTRIDPVAAKIQKFFPEPNAINPANPTYNNYYFSAARPVTRKWYLFKVDGDITPTNHITISGMPETENLFTPSPDCPIDCGTNKITEFASQVTDTWTLSSSAVNEFRVAAAREALNSGSEAIGKGYPNQIGLPNLPSNTFPSLSISSGPSISMGGSYYSYKLAETAIAVSDTMSWILGRHDLKIGGEYDNWTDVLQFPDVNAGSFSFNGIDTRDPNSNDAHPSAGVGYADFLLGGVQSWNVSLPPELGGRVSNVQLFAQDYFKLRPNLTVNYGVRFLVQNGWTVTDNAFANYDATLRNPGTGTLGALAFGGVQIPSSLQERKVFIAPRLGFAYAITPTWAIRGGFGLYPISWGGNDYLNGRGVGFSTQGAAQSSDNITPAFQLADGTPAVVVSTPGTRTPSLLNGQSISYAPYDTPVSYVDQFQFDVAHQMGNYAVEVAYVGGLGRDIMFATDINQVKNLGSGVRPNPTYQAINATLYTGESNYNALQIKLRRQFAHGFSLLANYTWAKTLDTGTASGGNGNGMDFYQNAYDTSANYGASANDVRHSINGSILYHLPFGRGKALLDRGGAVNALAGGWRLGSTFQAHSGVPFTPVMASNLSGALAGSWYPNRVGSIHSAHQSLQHWFNVNAFVAPAPNTFGDSRRNILYGPNYVDIDANLGKTFQLPMLDKQRNIEFRADCFDLLNHPNYGQPNAVIGSAGAGTISSSNTNRMMQLGVIVHF